MTRTQFLTLLCSPFVLPLLPKKETIHLIVENSYSTEKYVWNDAKYEWERLAYIHKEATDNSTLMYHIHGQLQKPF